VAAVMLGEPLRPNRKPILQVSRPDGRVLAYAKLGWNELTSELVRNEWEVLETWAQRPPRRFQVPRPLGLLDWNGVGVLLVEPVPQRVIRRGPRARPPGAGAVLEVAQHGGLSEGPLASVPLVPALLERAVDAADPRNGRMVTAKVAALVERAGDRSVAWGTAHGDWGPWNMSRGSSGLYVWDWERMSRGVPVGFDSIHFSFQTRAIGSNRPIDRIVADALGAAGPQLAELGVQGEIREPLMDLYLADMLLRLDAGSVVGEPVDGRLVTGLRRYLDTGSTEAT
jgi:hypothetical protein